MTDSRVTTVRFNAGQILFHENDPSTALFIIKNGQVEIFRVTPDHHKVPLGIVGSAEYLGDLGLSGDGARHSATAIAITEVEAIRIPMDDVLAQLRQAPSWLIALTKGLGQKLREAN